MYYARCDAKIKSKQNDVHIDWKNHRPNWIEQEDWVKLVDIWMSMDWQNKHKAGKAIRGLSSKHNLWVI